MGYLSFGKSARVNLNVTNEKQKPVRLDKVLVNVE